VGPPSLRAYDIGELPRPHEGMLGTLDQSADGPVYPAHKCVEVMPRHGLILRPSDSPLSNARSPLIAPRMAAPRLATSMDRSHAACSLSGSMSNKSERGMDRTPSRRGIHLDSPRAFPSSDPPRSSCRHTTDMMGQLVGAGIVRAEN
jgi:hypothetical protein